MGMRWTLAGEQAQGALFDADELVERHVGRGEFRGMEFLHVNARSVLNRVPTASRMPFEWTINPYRGCSHACTYCFARPTHAYLDLDTGEGFDRQIVVKINAAERARAELSRASWTRETVAFGTNTDPYQRAEGKYHLMRGLLRALIDCDTPFSILTKSTLILRDLDLLLEARDRVGVSVTFSIATLDAEVWRLTEPGTPHPERRIDAISRLTDAGIGCGVLMAPILPGLSDSDRQLRDVIEASLDAGARRIGANALYLHPIVRAHYLERLGRTHPAVAASTDELFGDRTSQPAPATRELSARVRSLVNDGLRRRGRPHQSDAFEFELRDRSVGRATDTTGEAAQPSLLDLLGVGSSASPSSGPSSASASALVSTP